MRQQTAKGLPQTTSDGEETDVLRDTVVQSLERLKGRRFCKKQQRQWTKRGAYLLLQTRVKTLHQELGAMFQRWYPDVLLEKEPLAA